ncbi:MAG: GNAT family N-acetyltransferase, partial [Sphaerochaetaceae bacterium]
MEIRTATPDDAPVIREIYRPYVESTVITFEYETPSEEELRRRIGTTLSSYPYLVATESGKI